MKNEKVSSGLRSYWQNIRSIARNQNLSIRDARISYKLSVELGYTLGKSAKSVRVLKGKKYRQVWHVKFKYDSGSGNYHDLMYEIEIVTVRDFPLSAQQVKAMAVSSLEVMNQVQGSDLPFVYTDIEIGLSEEGSVSKNEKESTQARLERYSHKIN